MDLLSALCLYSPLLCAAHAASLLPCVPLATLPSSSQCSLCSPNPAKLLAIQLFLKPIRVTNLHVYNKAISLDKPPHWGVVLYLSETPAATDSDYVLRC